MKKVKKRKSHAALIIILAIVVILAATGAGTWFWFDNALKPVSDRQEKIGIEITEGESKEQVLHALENAGLIRSYAAADLYSHFHSNFSYYTGTYELSPTMSVSEIFDYLSDQNNLEPDYAVVTIPEGTWAKDIAHIAAQAVPALDEQELLNLWNSADYVNQIAADYPFIDPAVVNNDQYFVKLEGYLYPETYYVDFDSTPDSFTRMLLDQFNIFYTLHQAEFEQSGMSVEDIVTFASVIQFESGDVNEMPVIAGVFKNRLDQQMPLQSSVTVCYALYDQFESPQDCETNPDIDSPYNTYMHDGLPIGPILNPGADALNAALHPQDNDYLYFVSDIYGDGKTYFATTYEEHLANVEKFGLNIESGS